MTSKEKMIKKQLLERDINDEKIIDAMRTVDRELFVPDEMKHLAYHDSPLPIGKGQTISQPYIVAWMAQALDLQPGNKVLEIGSGCGYNAAVLSHLVSQVYTIEIVKWLAELAKKNLAKAGIRNVSVRFGDGFEGWTENAPFDKITFTAATPKVPEAIKKQVKVGGQILAPVSDSIQNLTLYEKTGENKFKISELLGVRFVPMTGEIRK